jgi:hypothetical protein
MKQKTDYFLLHPRSRFKTYWDFLICLLSIFSIVIIPYEVGFDFFQNETSSILNYTIDAIFTVDCILVFNTAYYSNRMKDYVFDRPRIAKVYLHTWFLVDFFASFPFEAFFSLQFNQVFRFFRFFRITKLFGIRNVEKKNLFNALMKSTLTILILLLLFICHLIACAWHFIAIYPSSNRSKVTWLTEFGFEDADLFEKYVASFYWATATLFTIGYGDIHPVNNNERGFAILVMLLGGLIFV